eukprot:SAG31_NODE_13677_length_853_cov_2.847480_1_plen_70_part_00
MVAVAMVCQLRFSAAESPPNATGGGKATGDEFAAVNKPRADKQWSALSSATFDLRFRHKFPHTVQDGER